MSLSRREQFAALALPGLLSRTPHLDISPAVDLAFFVADEALAHSAPDAIEALEDLIREVEGIHGSQRWDSLNIAKAVLARYEKEPE